MRSRTRHSQVTGASVVLTDPMSSPRRLCLLTRTSIVSGNSSTSHRPAGCRAPLAPQETQTLAWTLPAHREGLHEPPQAVYRGTTVTPYAHACKASGPLMA